MFNVSSLLKFNPGSESDSDDMGFLNNNNKQDNSDSDDLFSDSDSGSAPKKPKKVEPPRQDDNLKQNSSEGFGTLRFCGANTLQMALLMNEEEEDATTDSDGIPIFTNNHHTEKKSKKAFKELNQNQSKQPNETNEKRNYTLDVTNGSQIVNNKGNESSEEDIFMGQKFKKAEIIQNSNNIIEDPDDDLFSDISSSGSEDNLNQYVGTNVSGHDPSDYSQPRVTNWLTFQLTDIPTYDASGYDQQLVTNYSIEALYTYAKQ